MAWVLAFTGGLAAQTLSLNELVASNHAGLQDEDGDHPDWIEIYNGSGRGLNVGGYGLSDDRDEPFKWRLPPLTLPSPGYMVVFASGKNRDANALKLHANFSIRASGEPVILTAPSGETLSELPSRTLPMDVSLGCLPDGSANWVYFTKPTPRAKNGGASFPTIAPTPTFSFEGGFYEAAFSVAIRSASQSSIIRYTLDGSEPTPTSTPYAGPILLRDRRLEPNNLSLIPGTSTVNQHTDGWFPPSGVVAKAMVLRARAFRESSVPSDVATRTWFIGTNSPSRFQLPVISLTTDTNGLFDYTRGIYVLGKLFDDYRAAHPNEPLTGHTPANYQGRGPEWERLAHLEFFKPDGKLAFERDVEIQIEGQSSRSFRQKSMGVRSLSSDFPADILPGRISRGTGQTLKQFSKIRLSNSGNDWAYTLYRDALCHVLADELPLDSLAYKPSVVFLDGEFWGIHNIREEQDGDWISAHYGVARSDVIICEGAGALLEGRAGEEMSFVQLREYIRTNDLSRASAANYVASKMDVSNFLLYHAAEIYFGNADWPHNNIRYWRKRTPAPDDAALKGHNGRWRWLLFDVDLGYAHPWSGGYSANTLAAATDPTGPAGLNAAWSTVILRQLLKAQPFRDQFINQMTDLLNTSFREDRVARVIDQLNGAITPAMPEHIRRWRTMENSMTGWSNQVRVMRTFGSQRPIYVRQHLGSYFQLPGAVNLIADVQPPKSGIIQINSTRIVPPTPGVNVEAPYPWRGRYFRSVPMTIEAIANPGWQFAGWEGIHLLNTNRLALTLSESTDLIARFEPVSFEIRSVARLTPDALRIHFSGVPNARHQVERSTDFNQWIVVADADTDNAGQSDVDIPWNDSPGAEFFRVVRR